MASRQIGQPADLARLLHQERARLLADWEDKARRLPTARELTAPALLDHIPLLLDDLTRALENAGTPAAGSFQSPLAHGRHRLTGGFNLTEVVEEYRFLRQCIFELTERQGWIVAGPACALVNDFIDSSVSASVQAYVEQRDLEERRRREEHLAFIVHDLRSPLSAIYQGTAVIEKEFEGQPTSDRARAMLSAVRRNIQQMRALIVKVLQEEANIRMAANVELKRQASDLRTVVENAVKTLEPLARSSETRVLDQVPPGIRIDADPALLERVFQNLISNAIDYAPRGEVRVGAVARDPGGVECWVSDDGPGIPDELKGKIFDKHHTQPRRRGGIGLGLAIVRQLVEAHGGRVDVQTEAGKGTTFRMVIPRERDATGAH
jgi:signal transduction histidine kinase